MTPSGTLNPVALIRNAVTTPRLVPRTYRATYNLILGKILRLYRTRPPAVSRPRPVDQLLSPEGITGLGSKHGANRRDRASFPARSMEAKR